MPFLPTSPRRRRLVVGVTAGVALLLLVAGVWNRRTIGDVYTYFFPGESLDGAADRTSAPAPVVVLDDGASDDVPADEQEAGAEAGPGAASDDPQSTDADPTISLARVVALDRPSAVADPTGPGPVLVTTLDGRVHAADLDAGATEVVLDLSDQVSTGGERGLLGMTLGPAGERLYLDYTNRDGDTEIRSWPVADGRPVGGPADGVLHLRIGQPFRNHNAGHLAFGPDGLLWIGVGDGGSANDPGDVAQDPSEILGKMLRVQPDPSGGVVAPASNPDWGGRPEIWGIGLRNPWRYSFDRATGLLWVADVGQSEIEEVTVVDPGADRVNFGWDLLEGTRPFEGEPAPSLSDPVVEYTHAEGCSITGGYVYRGTAVPSLVGWYLFGDYCGGWIRAVPADDPTRTPQELVAGAGPAISFAELDDGELLFLTSDGLHRILEG